MQENDYIALLARQFAEGLPPNDTALLDAWIAASPRHAALARQLREVWEQAGRTAAPIPALDLDADYRRVQARIRAESAVPRGRVVSMAAWWRAAAAAVVLVAAGIWGFQHWSAGQAGPLRTEQAGALDVRRLELPDGSRVWLRRNAALEFPERFATAERRVRLDGEAYFEVEHQADRPFRVETTAGDRVEVLGTAFAVHGSTPQAVEVLVRSGRVRFTPARSSQPVELSARQKAVYDRAAGKITVASEASLNELAWQTGGLEFVATPLQQVVHDLERFYQVKIELENPSLRNCRHTAPLTRQPIDAVLRSLAVTYALEVRQPAPGQYVLVGGNCR